MVRMEPSSTSKPASPRMEQLQKLLQKTPGDTFLLYAIALEYKKADRAEEALDYLDRVIRADPGYCYAYHQKGLVHESRNDLAAARLAYREGIEAATRKGDLHARSEIEGALSLIE